MYTYIYVYIYMYRKYLLLKLCQPRFALMISQMFKQIPYTSNSIMQYIINVGTYIHI